MNLAAMVDEAEKRAMAACPCALGTTIAAAYEVGVRQMLIAFAEVVMEETTS